MWFGVPAVPAIFLGLALLIVVIIWLSFLVEAITPVYGWENIVERSRRLFNGRIIWGQIAMILCFLAVLTMLMVGG